MSDTETRLKKDRMEKLISDFRSLRSVQRTERFTRMQRFILDFDLCARREADFNVFALLGVKTVRRQIADFFTFYAKLLSSFDIIDL